ncbi:MAG TPA: RNA polymerase sigma factor [Blastocatellia bacterium]|nr:RNA polymerase sigma factor [Blastocatellia bacterium]
MLPQISIEPESSLVDRARSGDEGAFTELVEPLRRPLFAYVYRMVTHRADAEDLMQEVLVRVLENLRTFREQASFKTWVFGIATHACLDHLRSKKRWRVEAQLEGEREHDASPEQAEGLKSLMSQADFVYEVREHITFCFACIGRTLEPEEQAAMMLKEVLGFTALEAAGILQVSEPIFRHRLSSARAKMIESFEGLCQLINKSGACWQCRGLHEHVPEGHRGAALVQIEVAPGMAVTPENLFEARLAIVREADLEQGTTRAMHDMFYEGISEREENVV